MSFRKLLSVAAMVGASVAGLQPSAAQAVEKPKPEWSMSVQSTRSTDGVQALPWACHGTANKPHSIAGPGIGFDARQECSGFFEVQKVCVKLQELDYYGYYYDRTSYRCSKETVAAVQTAGWSVTCAGALEGTFRTYARGYAWPEGVQHTEDGYSSGVRMCVGY